MTDVNPMRQRMLDYLSQFGLVPKNIKYDGWTDEGFIAMNPITGGESRRIPWPDGFNFQWFATLVLVAEREDYRLAGLRSPV